MVDSSTPDDVERLAFEFSKRSDAAAVVAAGGDGTLNGVLNGVRNAGEDIPVGLVPGGTGNVWAREAGIPKSPNAALELLGNPQYARVDLGIARIGDRPERCFLLMCGLGLDASVVREVERHPALKRAIGRGAFLIPMVRGLVRSEPTRCDTTLDGVHRESSLVVAIAANARLYGGVIQLADRAVMDDGLLDVVTFESRRGWLGRMDQLRHVSNALRGGLSQRTSDQLRYEQAHSMQLTPAGPVPIQTDGEYIGESGPASPLILTIEARAVRMVVGIRPPVSAGSVADVS